MKSFPIILLFLLSFPSILFSQTLDHFEGNYLVEEDGITHSFEFKKNKLTVRLNLYDAFQEQFIYQYRCIYNDDKTLDVVLLDIKTESLDETGGKKKKSRSIATHSITSGNFWSVWTVDKIEENKIYINVKPGAINWPFSKEWLAMYYSGFEHSFVLIPTQI